MVAINYKLSLQVSGKTNYGWFDVNLTLFGWKRKPKERYERKTINATHLSFLLWAVAKYILLVIVKTTRIYIYIYIYQGAFRFKKQNIKQR